MAPDESEQKIMTEVFEVISKYEFVPAMRALIFCIVMQALRGGAGTDEGGKEFLIRLTQIMVDGCWDAARDAVHLSAELQNAGPRH